MQLRHLTSLLQATEGMCKVTAIAFSPNNRRLAVVTVDRVVHLFDGQTGERKDKFSTKPADKGDKNYIVRTLEFSPDSSKLAVAQSDNIIFVYKIGLEFGDKKSICNKFPQPCSVTTLTWPSTHPNEIVFGLADGKVKVGQLRSNKPATLYATGSYVSRVCSNPEGTAILSAHYDGAIYRFIFDDVTGGPTHAKLVVHSCVPYALSWGESIVAAGNDRRVSFYDKDGAQLRTFDYSSDEKCGEFTCSVFNPTGESVVVGNFDSFYTFNFQPKTESWELVGSKSIPNLYSVTALAWKHDGSRLAVGSVCGALDLYDACVRRYRYKGKFEFTYVSLSQVIVKRLATGARVVVRSAFGCEITKLNVFQDRFLVGNTTNTLLVGDLDTARISEVQWQSTGAEKYMLDNESVCIVYQAGELSLIEYGQNELLGSVRTEHLNTHLLSVRINERPSLPMPQDGGDRIPPQENKKIAYLLDLQTICINDLHARGASTVNHDSRVDWLELNSRGNLLLFRDKRRQLHLFDLDTQKRSTLLNYCNYVQWVPESDVVVAQNRGNLSVWYNIRSPDKATIYQIKGDVEQIERGNGRTEVIVDEGMNTASYQLDESLIAFGAAVDDGQLVNAMSILEPLELTPETEAMWSQLSQEALTQNDHRIAERCAAALGDVARSRYLRKLNKLDWQEKDRLNGLAHWKVRARLAVLKNDYRSAEHLLLAQGQVDEAIEMYQHLHKWEDAIRVAEAKNHSGCEQMKRSYYDYLVESRQEEKAAAVKVKDGDYASAVSLYLKGGLPAKAALLLNQRNLGRDNKQLMETVADALYSAGMFEKAGDQFEKMEQESRALAAFIKANAFRKAVELSRKHFPDKVLRLEEAWGDYLVSQKQMDMAINHYIEGNVPTKAVEAALNSRQWAKASQLVETLEDDVSLPYYRRLARHYQEAGNLEQAERCFIKADAARDAVEMYTRANKWDAAYQVALNHLDKYETERLYVEQAHRMERAGKLKEAEKLFLTVNEPDLAINMYKNHKNYEQMIRLVTKYRKDLLKDTHLYLAQQLEHEGNYKEAEHHFAEAGEWQAAVNMYRTNDMWDEAIRVAKFHGGINASKRVAYAWAMDLGGEQGAKLLTRLGLIEPAIDYAIESGAFEHAFELARNCATKKLPEVHLKHALFLEDEERFKEAEEEFIKAGKPREALDMYVHQQDWQNAMRVAESADPASVADVFIAQARLWIERKEHQRAEGFFLSAGKPELALAAYLEAAMWADAVRIAKRHLPHKLMEVNMAHQRAIFSGGPKKKEELMEACEMWVASQQYVQAIDAYLSISIDQISDLGELEELWAKAIEICSKHDPSRYKSIVEEVASRLLGMSRFDAAAEHFQSIDKMKEALDCFLRVNNWAAAQKLCEQHAPELLPRLERAQQASAFGSAAHHPGEAKMAASSYTPSADTKVQYASEKKESKLNADGDDAGRGTSALDAWMQRGEWDKVLSSAAKHSPGSLAKYLVLRCSRLCEHDEMSTAIKTISDYGIPLDSEALDMTERLVQRTLACGHTIEEDAEHQAALPELVNCLRKLVKDLRANGKEFPSSRVQKIEQWLLVTHFFAIKHQAANAGLDDLVAKISMSLLRFVAVLPADKMFYLAGAAARKKKWLSAAFVYFNRYLDLCEAIDDGDASNLDNTDFIDTDIPSPQDFALPEMHYLAEESAREEIRDWVLTISMDQQVAEKLPERACLNCKASIYEAALQCPECKTASESCIVTGFPVAAKTTVHCATCKVIADRETWNKWVKQFGNCPWCSAPQKMSY
ncbi:Intraflagellar transport protein [Phytophthora cactorum]|uniref:Intraflagellar transport protein n=1 Tax=Phytophthora cactorum TaxID=29920 RepID=A0A329T0B6_9STRA|nr:Intraflagellar transport protein [Phytophthora cactorum]KAG2845877.1 Intraflagellar transport protein [Phytophthora cactorum]KAG2847422.1 Intraflagellar transport protein [Phytophthora cactorum]KAG2868148.1 Intraflagellar transport protein [Phytophthora cactorum]KAG2933007.1 Intraflagellar transport protein [Phytophthora cactorum]